MADHKARRRAGLMLRTLRGLDGRWVVSTARGSGEQLLLEHGHLPEPVIAVGDVDHVALGCEPEQVFTSTITVDGAQPGCAPSCEGRLCASQENRFPAALEKRLSQLELQCVR